MPPQEKHTWIMVIQSLSDKDPIKSGKGLSIDLKTMCKLSDNCISSFYEVSSIDELKTKFDNIIGTIQDCDHLILHIDSHGDECGIGLGKEFLFWNDFTEMLTPLYNKTQKNLVLIFTCCKGLFFSKASNNYHIPCSFFIASRVVINGGIAGRAFRKFYKEYINSASIPKAFDAITAYYKWHEQDNPFELLSFGE